MLNKAILVGRLTADPELKKTTNDISVTRFNIAINRNYQTAGKREADFITIVAWRQAAEFVCKYFKKGSSVGIDGSIQTRNYEDNDGNKRTAFEVVADSISFVGSAKRDEAPLPDAPPELGKIGDFQVVEDDDDLPF